MLCLCVRVIFRFANQRNFFWQGTSSEQDNRFFNKEKKLLKSLKYAPNLNQKVCLPSHSLDLRSRFEHLSLASFHSRSAQVDMSKVNLDVVKPWITNRVTELLGTEDEVLVDFVFNMLESEQVMCIAPGMSHGRFISLFFPVLFLTLPVGKR